MRNNLFTFAPWLPLLFHHAHWDQTEESLYPSLGSGPTLAQGPSTLVPVLVQPSTICPFSHLQKTSQNIPFRLGLPPADTGVPNGLLMLQNNLNDFVFEHRSGCCATEPGYAGDIGAIKSFWLIDWFLDQKSRHRYLKWVNHDKCVASPSSMQGSNFQPGVHLRCLILIYDFRQNFFHSNRLQLVDTAEWHWNVKCA